LDRRFTETPYKLTTAFKERRLGQPSVSAVDGWGTVIPWLQQFGDLDGVQRRAFEKLVA
jgi:hypothetical protein